MWEGLEPYAMGLHCDRCGVRHCRAATSLVTVELQSPCLTSSLPSLTTKTFVLLWFPEEHCAPRCASSDTLFFMLNSFRQYTVTEHRDNHDVVANRMLIKLALLNGHFDHRSHSENEAETDSPEEEDSKQIIPDLQ